MHHICYEVPNIIDACDKLKAEGATILGGCCEIKPSHIKAISEIIKI